eukprot:8361362-Alexandrium_andersonii.AAC.1
MATRQSGIALASSANRGRWSAKEPAGCSTTHMTPSAENTCNSNTILEIMVLASRGAHTLTH